MKWILYDLMCIMLSIITMPIQAFIMGCAVWWTILVNYVEEMMIDIRNWKNRGKDYMAEIKAYMEENERL